ncbi:unnamed protein product [Orchesella dallaii]|uniref:C2H2-type domain-containing protein n=1 Tax=Orchesella dallaii TaxID=48710 RepID=A0ABP1RMR5_9HEXA
MSQPPKFPQETRILNEDCIDLVSIDGDNHEHNPSFVDGPAISPSSLSVCRSSTSSLEQREAEEKPKVEVEKLREEVMDLAGVVTKMNYLIKNNNKRILELEKQQEKAESVSKNVKMAMGESSSQKSNRDDGEKASTSTSNSAKVLKCFESNCYMKFASELSRNEHTTKAHSYKMLQDGRFKCSFGGNDCNGTFQNKTKFWEHYWEEQ